MKILLFYHSLLSDWNHGNAHFLRGITTELLKRGHNVQVFEPREGWSFTNWQKEKGKQGIREFKEAYPHLSTNFYETTTDLEPVLRDADLVVVHEWNDTELVKRLGDLKSDFQYRLLFHDTHHRSATTPDEISRYDLTAYDGVLAFGEVVKNIYLENRWTERAWTWHEAADTSLFRPMKNTEQEGDVVWIGNWGDDERTEELKEFFIDPVKELGLKARMYGVRYPESALQLLREAGIEYGGYLPSYQVPEVFSRYRFTVHVPRRPYAKALPGIPTIRPFEAMACGIPLISAPWKDSENLFRTGTDFMMVPDGTAMKQGMQEVLQNTRIASSLRTHGLETVRSNHTCAHRTDELLQICNTLSSELENIDTEPLESL